MKRNIKVIADWSEWIKAWKNADNDSTLLGLLHEVVDIAISNKHLRFLLLVADVRSGYNHPVRKKALAAYLSLNLNTAVSDERIIDALLWFMRPDSIGHLVNGTVIYSVKEHLKTPFLNHSIEMLLNELGLNSRRMRVLKVLLARIGNNKFAENMHKWLFTTENRFYTNTTMVDYDTLELKLSILDEEAMALIRDRVGNDFNDKYLRGDKLAAFVVLVEETRRRVNLVQK